MMESIKDYYKILSVSEHATEEEIKSAYRRLAKKYHPDAHPGDAKCEERFQEINEAYDVLGDSGKRKAYDEKKRKTEGDASFRRESSSAQEKNVDFENIHKSFARFFGFDPRTQDITDEEKLKGRAANPMDTTEIFERFMGIKR